MKKETNTHNEHQKLPQKTEYSPGISADPPKNRGKPETIHSPTNASKQHNKYSDQGYSIHETTGSFFIPVKSNIYQTAPYLSL